ncbi:MAG: hypothetical protein MUP03_09160 [Anaerolineales bacterium]|nr:hypothetical protein [Anaerolineales bacterium]
MRPFEILIAVFLALCFIRPVVWLHHRPRWSDFLPTITFLVTILHCIIEGIRWQMVPHYGLSIGVFLFSLPQLLQPGERPVQRLWLHITGTVAGIVLTAISTALPALLPIPHVLKPTGPYQPGTFTLMLTDNSRKEIYSGNSGEPRRIMIQVWYPTSETPGAKTAPWMEHPEVVAPAISRYLKLPSFFLDHLKYARSDSIPDAPLASDQPKYPVLLFSHGWNGFRAQNTFQMQELASHGYIVVGLEHTYGAVVTVFPDGQIAMNSPTALPSGVKEETYDRAARVLVDQWASDLGFVLDTLNQLNTFDREHGFAKRLDLERVGVFGHSTGGGAAVEFCSRDPRCKAGLGMDAFLTTLSTSTLESGVSQPFLFMFSEKWPSLKNTRLLKKIYSNSTGPFQEITISGTKHYDFTDLPMLTPIASRLGLKGPINGARALRIINDYSLAFFGEYLLDEPSELLHGPQPEYPELTILSHT